MSIVPIPPLGLPPLVPLPRFTNQHYYVEIDSVLMAVFNECTGLGVTIATDKVTEGGNNVATRHLPKQASCKPVTLKYGVALVDEVWNWFEMALSGMPQRRTIVVHQYMNNGVFPGGLPMVSWRLHDCLPVDYSGPTFTSDGAAKVSVDAIKVQPSSLERL
jgi:phage tail-like protein